ncbi:MAG: hypothetical protein J5877_00500 [Clostridia bacterium]|nr:hypothetical protein [Clostridia bacterium]
MKLVEYHCPNCTATLQVDTEKREAVCEYCGSKFNISDERYDAEQEGYDFEKGGMRAREEMRNENQFSSPSVYSAPKKRRTWLWVLGWIFFFPIPLTVLIVKSKLNTPLKIVLIAILWGFVFYAGATGDEGTGSAANILINSLY